MKARKNRRFISLIVCILLVAAFDGAGALTIPEGTVMIGDEAFEGCGAFDTVVVPESVTAIGSRAFRGCAALDSIFIPASVIEIGDDILTGCAADVLVHTVAGSTAAGYALSHCIDFNADTAYRALVIGQKYQNSYYPELQGPTRDAESISLALTTFPDTPWEVTTLLELTSEGIYQAITDVFSEATADDVSLFYYSGHGLNSSVSGRRGALIGADDVLITAAQLRRALDAVPGRKIVIVDACYSGNLIVGRSAPTDADSGASGGEAFVESFIDAFSATLRSRSAGTGSLAGDQYFVLTASTEDEKSYEGKYGHGFFTYYLMKGIGWDGYRNQPFQERAADQNGNGSVTIEEAFEYAHECLLNDAKLLNAGINQHSMCWPDGCDWFGFLREGAETA